MASEPLNGKLKYPNSNFGNHEPGCGCSSCLATELVTEKRRREVLLAIEKTEQASLIVALAGIEGGNG